jgi:carbamate kinase
MVKRFSTTGADQGCYIIRHEYVVDTFGASSIGGGFVVRSQMGAKDIDKVVSSDYSSEAMHVKADFLIEVTAEDNLVASKDFCIQEAVKTLAELATGMLVKFFVSFHLEDLLLMCGCFAGRSGVLWNLVR